MSWQSSIFIDSFFWPHAIIDLTIVNHVEQRQFCKVGLGTVMKLGMVFHQDPHWSFCQEQTQSKHACWKHQGQGTVPCDVEVHPNSVSDMAVDKDVLLLEITHTLP